MCGKFMWLTTQRNVKWIDQHDTNGGQRKNLNPRQELNPWPQEHWEGALSTELQELMETKVILLNSCVTGILPTARISIVEVIMSSDKWIEMVNFELANEIWKVNSPFTFRYRAQNSPSLFTYYSKQHSLFKTQCNATIADMDCRQSMFFSLDPDRNTDISSIHLIFLQFYKSTHTKWAWFYSVSSVRVQGRTIS